MRQTVRVLGAAAMLCASVLGTQVQAQEREKSRTQPPKQQPQKQQPQRGQQPQRDVGNGHIPASGPPRPSQPSRDTPPARATPPSAQRPDYRDRPDHPAAPHVHNSNDEWYGRADTRNDSRYRVTQPWQHGRFMGTIGPRQIYRMRGGTRLRFNLGGSYFSVSQADWGYSNDWLWNSDDLVLYDDEYNDGWYLAYNARLGTYVHVMYLGN
jgi:hypothetical protein